MTSEKPIIFSTPMVRAILAGRKTQTRRVVKPQPTGSECYGICTDNTSNKKDIGKIGFGSVGGEITEFCKPRFVPGDVLWVRESIGRLSKEQEAVIGRAIYRTEQSYPNMKWRPSIYMPRTAARIFLRVTDVRVERVQEITIDDCMREGYPETLKKGRKNIANMGEYRSYAKTWYMNLWDSLNAKRGYSWKTNPWVWVISFKRTEPC